MVNDDENKNCAKKATNRLGAYALGYCLVERGFPVRELARASSGHVGSGYPGYQTLAGWWCVVLVL